MSTVRRAGTQITLALFLTFGLLFASTVPPVAADNGQQVSNTAHANTTEMALSPDGKRTYLVWYDFQNAQGEGLGEVYFRYRDDSGNWRPALDQAPLNLSGTPQTHSEQPTITVDRNGGINVVWGEGRPRVLLGRYLPPGADPANLAAWTGQFVVSNEEDVQNANLAADNAGGVWVVYTSHATGTYEIFARHGTGTNWEGSQNVSRSEGRGAFVGKVAVDSAGVVSVVWWERGGIRYAARTDRWQGPETVSPVATQQSGIAIEQSGRIHIVYTETFGPDDSNRRIVYRTRAAWNAPWTAPEAISGNGNMLEPRIAWANGRLVAVWNDRSSSPPTIYVAQNLGNGWRDRQAWTNGIRSFSPWVVLRADTVAYIVFRNASVDQINFSVWANAAAPVPPAPPVSPVSPAQQLPGAYFFQETQHNLGGSFLSYWQRNGGLAQFGYPLTEEFTEQSADDGNEYTVQYFERARFEYHREYAGTPNDVLLGRLGLRQHAIDPPAQQADGASYFSATGHNLGGSFRDYWLAHGGLAIFGLPITEEFTEVGADGRPYTVQYFERNRFELHPENAPPYNVLLGLLGRDELISRGWIQR